jgi:hypothetical protein
MKELKRKEKKENQSHFFFAAPCNFGMYENYTVISSVILWKKNPNLLPFTMSICEQGSVYILLHSWLRQQKYVRCGVTASVPTTGSLSPSAD